MSENRNVRASETRTHVREEQVRPKVTWKPPALLDSPEPRPGMTQRWISTSIRGKDNPDNLHRRMREGWNPRPADTVKDKLFQTINHGQWAGSIGIEGMILCEMPIETHKQMKSYYNNKNSEQNESISGDLDALGRQTGQSIYQTRKSSSSRGRDYSAMED